MAEDLPFWKKRAPTLYVIIANKLIKGLTLLVLGFWVYSLSDSNLTSEFKNLLQFFHLDPGKQVFADLASKLDNIAPANVTWLAGGTILCGLVLLVEGTGLILRLSWAGWLAIGKSAFFIPIEMYELMRNFSWFVILILSVNVTIVWYLFQNRHRLFRHRHAE